MKNTIDPIDLAALILFPFFSAIALGTIALNVNVFGGFDFGSALWSGSGIEVTWAALIAVAAVVWIIGTNELDGSDYESYEYVAILVALGIVPLYVVIPLVSDLVNQYDLLSLGLVFVSSGAAVLVSYVE